MSNKILITGSGGFIGNNFLKHIFNDSDEFFLIVRNNKNLLEFEKFSNITLVYTSDLFLESLAWWRNVTHGINIIIHSAWYMNKIDNLSSDKNLDCLIGTINIANAAKLNKVDKFLAIGSCFEYSSSDLPLSVESPTQPSTLYGASKLSTFLFLNQIFINSKTTFYWCRLFYLYGPGEGEERLYPYINKCISEGVNVIINNPNSTRDYMNIKDAIEKMAKVLNSTEKGIFNICTGTPILIKDFVLNLINNTESKLEINYINNENINIIVGVPSL